MLLPAPWPAEVRGDPVTDAALGLVGVVAVTFAVGLQYGRGELFGLDGRSAGTRVSPQLLASSPGRPSSPRRIEGIDVQGWHARAVRNRRAINRLRSELRDASKRTLSSVTSTGYWVARQISVANIIGAQSAGDPWPNCPDPFDGQGSWQDTVDCENNGSWLDSPGFYRCGLQFDPMWERRYGQLCP